VTRPSTAERRARTRRTLLLLATVLTTVVLATPRPTPARAAAAQAPAGGTATTTTAPDGPPDERDEATGGADEPLLRLVEQTTWVAPDGELTLRLTADAPPGASIEVTVHDRPVGRNQFREDLVTGPSGAVIGRSCATLIDGGFAVLDPCEVPLDRAELDADDAVSLGIGLRSSASGPPDRLLIGADADGAYPIQVRLLDDDGTELDRLVTHLLRAPADSSEAPPLDVSLVVPIDAALALQPDGTTVLDREARATVGATIGALVDRPEVPLVVVPTPETLDALSLDEGGQQLLAALAGALDGRQVLAQPYVHADPGSWWGAGLDAEYDELRVVGADAVRTHLGVSPDVGTTLVGPTTDGIVLTRLAETGTESLVVPQDLLTPIDETLFGLDLDRPFSVTVEDGPTLPAVLDDAALDAHLGETGDPRLDAHHLLADLTVLYSQFPGIPRGVALRLPTDQDDTTGDAAPPVEATDLGVFLTTLLDGIATSPTLRGATVPDLLDRAETARVGGSEDREGEPLTRTYVAVEPPGLGSYPEARRTTEAALVPYRAIAGTEALPLVDQLVLVSGDGRLTETEQQAYLDSALAQVADLATGIVLPPASRVTLTAREGLIPVELRNDLERPVDVLVRLESDKLEFPEGDERIVTLPPGPTQLEWLVRTRASGAFPVEVSVLSPDGSIELDSTRFTMRSTAVPGVGIALSAIAAVFLAVWWARHWHTARRAQRLV
jgi:hypothetical protein